MKPRGDSSLALKYLLWGAGSCLAVAGIWFLMAFCAFNSEQDRFTAIESLFTGLAFAIFIVALLMQREELELQREELKATRQELAGQKQQMEAQNRTLTLQRFENTFFQMISLHHQIVESMSHGQIRGRRVMENAFDSFSGTYTSHYGQGANPEPIGISQAYRDMWKLHGRDLEHYFHNLHNLAGC